jgi:peptidoglycan hydrolase CwlO-like protein
MPSLQLLDYSTANSIEHFIQYYTFFSTVSMLLNVVRFLYCNFFKSDKKDEEIHQLKEQIDNLQNVLEEVVKHLNRTNKNYDEEKAEFVEKDESDIPTTDVKED